MGFRRWASRRPAGARLRGIGAGWLLGLGLIGRACAAPLDAFLEASPHLEPRTGFVEIAVDAMNRTLDVFNLRPEGLADDSVGNLQGFHLRAGYALNADLWVDGSLFRRQVTYAGIDPGFTSWQLGAQYRLWRAAEQFHADGALRVSVWGSRGDDVSATRSQLQSRPVFSLLDELSVNRPEDRQIQADLIYTWWLGPAALTAFGGAGSGQVTVRSVTARVGSITRRWIDGRFVNSAGQVDDALAGLIEQLGLAAELNAIDYSTRFVHAGLGLRLPLGDWSLRGAYQLFSIRRQTVDDLIAARAQDNSTYRVNHTLTGELSHRFTGSVRGFIRGQAMSNQFLAEMPLLYNSLTARRFGEKYGIVSAGLIIGF
jgi:hypothetical protein